MRLNCDDCAKRESYEQSFYKIYMSGKEDSLWDLRINWQRIITEQMPDNLKRKAYELSILSSQVEQIGMFNAAELLKQCQNYNLQMAIAQTVMDEARHMEVFTKYAYLTSGVVPNKLPTDNELGNHFSLLKSFDEIFLSHVYLENLALEQFFLYIEVFDSYLISDLYRGALSDEARHVALGVNYFRSKLTPELVDKLARHILGSRELLGVSLDGCRWIADLTGLPVKYINKRMIDRQDKFLKKIGISITW